MARTDPFIIPLPHSLANDPETGPWFQYTQKFLHDLWQRTGAGSDLIDGAAQLTANQTFSGTVTFTGGINLSGISLQIDGTQVLTVQQSAVADAAPTATAPASITGYAPHASGAVTVTSNAATDLDTTAAALDTLVDEVTALRSTVNDLVTDMADVTTQLNALLAEVRDHGAIAT